MKKIVNLLLISLLLIHCSDDNNPPPITLKYTLTTEANPAEGGSISPASGSYEKGSTVTIKATPSNGYTFKKWSGGLTGDSNPATLTMNTDKKVVAEFEIIAPTYTNGEGIIGPNGGTVTIEDSNSPLNGVSVVIPEGALASDKNISIKHDTQTTLEEFENILIAEFEPHGLEFKKPVTITLPYLKELENPTIYLHQPDSNSVEQYITKSYDNNNKTVSTEVEHFSRYFADDYPKIQADIDVYKLNESTKVKIQIGGNNKGLRGIKADKAMGINTALDLTQTNITNLYQWDLDLYATFKINILKKNNIGVKISQAKSEIFIRRDGKSSTGFSISVHNSKNPSAVLNEINNASIEDLDAFFNGSALVIPLDYVLEYGTEYFLKASWVMSNNPQGINNYVLGSRQATRKYKFQAKINSLGLDDPDENNNLTSDNFDPRKPNIKINKVEPISNSSVKVTCHISDDGGSNIDERGVYYSINVNPDGTGENDKVQPSSSGGDGTFYITIDNLETNTNYYFAAYAKNEAGLKSLSGQEHILTGNNAPQVTISEPETGASFQKGEIVNIKFTATDSDGEIKKITVYVNDIKEKEITTVQNLEGITWDTSNKDKGEYEIKVTATDETGEVGEAKITIIIKDGNLAITEPTSSTIWQDGDQNKKIEWETGKLGGNVSIQLFKGDQKQVTLSGTENTENDGSFSVDVGSSWSEGDNYRIKIVSIEYPDKSDFSSYFEIKEATNLAPEAPKDEYPKNGAEITETKETLFWTCSDPEGDPLTYDIYFGTNESPQKVNSTKQTENTYDLTNLVEGTTYYWYIIAHDDHGNSTQSDVWSFKVLSEDQIYIPDDVFETYLIRMGYDDEMDNHVLSSNISNIKSIRAGSFRDLTGIEGFKSLEDLYLSDTYLSSINLNDNIYLKKLEIHSNYIPLKELIIDKNVNLEKLEFVWSDLSLLELDLSGNIALKDLDLKGDELTFLDVSNNNQLTELDFSDNNIRSIDLSKNPNLISINSSSNPLTDFIDLSQNQSLKALSCRDNQLTNTHVNQFSFKLTELYCSNNNISALDLSEFSQLEYLSAGSNIFKSLDLSKNHNLKKLYLRYSLTLEYLNIKNGNNHNMDIMWATSCYYLDYIIVDNVSEAESYTSGLHWMKEDDTFYTEGSIIPTSFNGRTNKGLGSVNLSSKSITISVWDHGQIDGDIVSIYVNGQVKIAERTLEGPESKFVVNTTLEYDGYNYLLLYAHNTGSEGPNTCAISIDDGVNSKEFTLEANLETNGAVDLIVN